MKREGGTDLSQKQHISVFVSNNCNRLIVKLFMYSLYIHVIIIIKTICYSNVIPYYLGNSYKNNYLFLLFVFKVCLALTHVSNWKKKLDFKGDFEPLQTSMFVPGFKPSTHIPKIRELTAQSHGCGWGGGFAR